MSNKFLWLGARDVNNNNTYYWETGDRVGFDNWRAGTPDGFASGDGGKCLSTMVSVSHIHL